MAEDGKAGRGVVSGGEELSINGYGFFQRGQCGEKDSEVDSGDICISTHTQKTMNYIH